MMPMRVFYALVVLLVFVETPGFAQSQGGNLLQNGDFSSGLAHWDGDGRSLATTTNAIAPRNGMGVELRAEWTKVMQNFDVKRGDYTVSITYSLTPGTTFTPDVKEYRKIPGKLGFNALKEFRVKKGEWAMIITDRERFVYCAIKPPEAGNGEQTVTGDFNLDYDGDDQTFCLAFPPGNGVVTILNIALTSKQVGSP
jgi:hypothetical protein